MTMSEDAVWLQRIANALDRLSPAPVAPPDLRGADAFLWNEERRSLEPVDKVSYVDLSLLVGIDSVRDILLTNTRQFASGLSANNALLWGARGMGKSSLIKAVHAHANTEAPHALALIEIHRDDISTLPLLLTQLRAASRRFLLFCDDLSFDAHDASYKSLKTVLEGGIEGRPENVLFYATSNRRHLLPREMIENEKHTAIHPGESAEEKISLSDRFGLWLGFHPCTLDIYLQIVESYAHRYGIEMKPEDIRHDALLWSTARGARSGRVAWQFIQDLAGKMGKRLA